MPHVPRPGPPASAWLRSADWSSHVKTCSNVGSADYTPLTLMAGIANARESWQLRLSVCQPASCHPNCTPATAKLAHLCGDTSFGYILMSSRAC